MGSSTTKSSKKKDETKTSTKTETKTSSTSTKTNDTKTSDTKTSSTKTTSTKEKKDPFQQKPITTSAVDEFKDDYQATVNKINALNKGMDDNGWGYDEIPVLQNNIDTTPSRQTMTQAEKDARNGSTQIMGNGRTQSENEMRDSARELERFNSATPQTQGERDAREGAKQITLDQLANLDWSRMNDQERASNTRRAEAINGITPNLATSTPTRSMEALTQQYGSVKDIYGSMTDAQKQAKIDELLANPNKLSKNDVEFTKLLVNDYEKNQRQNDLVSGGKEGYQRAMQMQSLSNRVNNLYSGLSGFASAVPGLDKLVGKIDSLGNGSTPSIADTMAKSKEQSPIANLLGYGGSKVGQYMTAGELLGMIPQVQAAQQGISNTIGGGLNALGGDIALNGVGGKALQKVGTKLASGLGTTIGNSVAGMATDQVLDTLLDVAPRTAEDVENGATPLEALGNALKYSGENALWNLGAEGVKQAFNGLGTLASRSDALKGQNEALAREEAQKTLEYLNGSNSIAQNISESPVARLMKGTATNSDINEIMNNPTLRAEAEEFMGESLSGSKAAQRQALKSVNVNPDDVVPSLTPIDEYLSGMTTQNTMKQLPEYGSLAEKAERAANYEQDVERRVAEELAKGDTISDEFRETYKNALPEGGFSEEELKQIYGTGYETDVDKALQGLNGVDAPAPVEKESVISILEKKREEAAKNVSEAILKGDDALFERSLAEVQRIDDSIDVIYKNGIDADGNPLSMSKKKDFGTATTNSVREEVDDLATEISNVYNRVNGGAEDISSQIAKDIESGNYDDARQFLQDVVNETGDEEAKAILNKLGGQTTQVSGGMLDQPTIVNPDMKTSKMATEGTFVKTDFVTEAEREARDYEEMMKYAVDHQDVALSNARNRLSTDESKKMWEKKLTHEDVSQYSPTDVYTSTELYKDVSAQARAAQKAGNLEEAKELWKRSDRLASKYFHVTNGSAKEMNAARNVIMNAEEDAVITAKRTIREKAVLKYKAEFVDEVEACAADVERKLSKTITDGFVNKDSLKASIEKIMDNEKYSSVGGRKAVNKMIDNFDFTNGNTDDLITDVINKIYKSNGIGVLTPEQGSQIYNLIADAMELGGDTYEARKLVAQAGKIVADQIPASFGQMFKAVTYINMLGNFKTAISRNLGGNLGFNAIEGLLTKPLATGLDKATSLATKQRAIPDLSLDRVGASVKGTVKGVADQWRDFTSGLSTARSGTANTLANAIGNNRRAFTKTEIPVLKQLSDFGNRVSKGVIQGMEFGDRPVFETVYASQKQGYENLVAKLQAKYGDEWTKHLNGFNPSKQTVEEYIDVMSTKAAEDAVSQNDGATAKGFDFVKRGIGYISKGQIGFDTASHQAMAFTRTPGNIIERSAEYTPLGLIKNAFETISEIASKDKSFDQRRFVNELARTLVGSGIEAASVAAAMSNLTTGGYSNDSDKKAAQIASGMQDYAINIDGKQYDASDIPVVGGYIESGSKSNERIQDKLGNITFDDLNDPEVLLAVLKEVYSLEAAKDTTGTLSKSSFMQGLNKLLGTNSSYSNNGKTPADNVVDTILSSSSQLVPSLSRQTAQTTDKYKRDYGEYGSKEYYLNMLKSNIPGKHGRESLNIKYDNEGNPVLQNGGRSLGEKIAENYFLPMTVSEYNPTPITQAADKIFEETGSASAYAPMENRSKVKEFCTKYGIAYSEDVYQQYKQERGTMNREIGEALLNDELFTELSYEQQAELFSKIYSVAANLEKMALSDGEYTTDDSYTKLYQETHSITDLVEKYRKASVYKENGLAGNSGKQLSEIYDTAYAEGGIEAANEAVKTFSEIRDFLKGQGLSASSNLYKELVQSDSLREAQLGYINAKREDIATQKEKEETKETETEIPTLTKDDETPVSTEKTKTVDGSPNITGLSNGNAVKVLESSNLDAYSKGLALAKNIASSGGSAKDNAGGSAKGLAANGDWENFYYYYLVKSKLDTDHNGRIKAEERNNLIPVLEQLNFDDATKNRIKGWTIR